MYHLTAKFTEDKETYYQIRKQEFESLNQIEQAARFIYLNRFCFNGLYRTNNKGEFNVPYGGLKSGKLPTKENFINISNLLKNVEIINTDFEDLILNRLEVNDFVYLDPPYAVKNKRIFKQYGPTNFGTNDMERLFLLLDYIDKKGAKFLLSYAYCEELQFLTSKWNSNIVTTQRNIAGFASNRRKEQEYLISNL